MTSFHSRPYHELRRRQIMDRMSTEAWAEPTLLVIAYDVQGRGGFLSEMLEFGTPFEGTPLFTYGVELAADETLARGDFPHVSCGVGKWKTEDGRPPRGGGSLPRCPDVDKGKLHQGIQHAV